MSRGIIEAQTLRSEQFEFEARTSDPGDAQPGEYWIRTDQTSTNPDVIAQLRRQDTSGVTTCPIFAAAEESNLGADVTRGPSVVLDDASVGFVAMTTGSGAVGSPRAVNSAGTEYVSHNALELNPIPDSGVSRWTFDDADTESGTAVDVWNGNGGTINGAATGALGANQTYNTNEAYDFNGADDYVDIDGTPPTSPPYSAAAWVNLDTGGTGSVIQYARDRWSINAGDFSGGTWAFRIFDGSNSVVADSSDSTSGVGSWAHFVGMHDGSAIRLYIDGSQVAETTGVADNGTGSNTSAVGANLDDSYYVDGRIDDPRIYDKALSDAEVSNLYNTGSIDG